MSTAGTPCGCRIRSRCAVPPVGRTRSALADSAPAPGPAPRRTADENGPVGALDAHADPRRTPRAVAAVRQFGRRRSRDQPARAGRRRASRLAPARGPAGATRKPRRRHARAAAAPAPASTQAAADMARRWLTRLDRERVRTALRQYYVRDIRLSGTRSTRSRNAAAPRRARPCPTAGAALGVPPRRFKQLAGLRQQRYDLQCSRPAAGPVRPLRALARPYAGADPAAAGRPARPGRGQQAVQFETTDASASRSCLCDGTASRRKDPFAYLGRRPVIVLSTATTGWSRRNRDRRAAGRGRPAWPKGIASFLTPEELHKLGRLALQSRYVVEGNLAGAHRSPHEGRQLRVRRPPGLHPGRRPQAHRLEGPRPHRPLLRPALRGRDQPARLPGPGPQRLDGLRQRRGRPSTTTPAAWPPRSATSWSRPSDSVGLFLHSDKIDAAWSARNSFLHLNNLLKRVQQSAHRPDRPRDRHDPAPGRRVDPPPRADRASSPTCSTTRRRHPGARPLPQAAPRRRSSSTCWTRRRSTSRSRRAPSSRTWRPARRCIVDPRAPGRGLRRGRSASSWSSTARPARSMNIDYRLARTGPAPGDLRAGLPGGATDGCPK